MTGRFGFEINSGPEGERACFATAECWSSLSQSTFAQTGAHCRETNRPFVDLFDEPPNDAILQDVSSVIAIAAQNQTLVGHP